MNVLFRNFFYAVVLVLLFGMHELDASVAQFKDLVLLVQSQYAFSVVIVITICLVCVELAFSCGGHRVAASGTCSAQENYQRQGSSIGRTSEATRGPGGKA